MSTFELSNFFSMSKSERIAKKLQDAVDELAYLRSEGLSISVNAATHGGRLASIELQGECSELELLQHFARAITDRVAEGVSAHPLDAKMDRKGL